MQAILNVIVQMALLAMPLLKPLAAKAPEKVITVITALRPIIDEAQRLAEEEEARRAAEQAPKNDE